MNLPTSRKLYRFFFAAALLLMCQPAWAEKRVALVIGNSAYKNVAQLQNPVNDGAVIATTLKNAGFDVVDSRHDLPAAETRRALRDFADRARDADIAVVYYAGHGMEVDGTNYLIPVDAKLERDTDVYDEAFSLDRVLLAIEPAKRLRLVILDACRDNPFAKSMKRTIASRGIGQGLAKIEPTSPNMLIAYSAKAGSTAADGDTSNSPFTIALSKHLTTPGLDVRRAFGFVRDDVLKNTSNRQEPYVYGSLGGDDVSLVPGKSAAPSAPASNPQAEARRDYELALQVGNKDALSAFLAQYSDGYYANLAKIQLSKLAAEETRVAATEKARQAEQERARLASEGAQKAQQQKAEADAKAAEQARVAAEKAKQVAQDKAADAERKRVATEAPTTDRPSEKIASLNSGVDRATINSSTPDKAPGDKAQSDKVQGDNGTNVASLSAGPSPAEIAKPSPANIAKSVQGELRRVGCLAGSADGEWNAASQRSMALFNRHAGTKLDVKLASLDALETIKLKSSRVCPLVCQHGFEADGDRCSKIVCGEGSFLNDDNECEKRRARAPTAKQNRDERNYRDERPARLDRPVRERPVPEARVSRPQASGQIVCDRGGCRPVDRGCHLEFKTTAQGGPVEGGGGNVQICR
jgi:Caspase domain